MSPVTLSPLVLDVSQFDSLKKRWMLELCIRAVCNPSSSLEDDITGISSEIRTKLRDWAVWQARAGCYTQAALSTNDSKTLYTTNQLG